MKPLLRIVLPLAIVGLAVGLCNERKGSHAGSSRRRGGDQEGHHGHD